MRKLIVVGVLCVALLLVACSNSNTNPISTPFIGGESALVLSFAPAAPPDEIFDNGQFPFTVAVNIENKGEFDLEEGEGYIEIDSINGATFGVSDNDLIKDIPAIDGARKNFDGSITEGFRDLVSFNNLNYQENLRGDLPITIRANACYNYETRTSTNICLKKETIDNINQNEVCLIGAQKQVQNSGAPIHITSLTEAPQGKNGVQVSFTIEHVGEPGALFYRDDALCDRRINNPEMYQVYVEVEPIVNGQINAECSGFQEGSGDAGYVTLFQGNPRVVTCSFDTASLSTDFIEPLSINLRYRYQQFIEKQVIVKDVATNDE